MSGKKPTQTRIDRLRRSTAIAARWLHIYLSMFSFAFILFFAATGFTLNHPDRFAGRDRTTHQSGQVTASLLHENGTAEPNKLAIVEFLRQKNKVGGVLSDFRTDDNQLGVSFKGPGYVADAFIDPKTGTYDLTETRSGFLAVVNDLHRGANAGSVWSGMIDVSAIFLTFVSLTGLALIMFLARRRLVGLLTAGIGLLLCTIGYWLFVP